MRTHSTTGLISLFLLQSLCALFFAFDAAVDIAGLEQKGQFRESVAFEVLVTAVLVVSLVFTAYEIRRVSRKQDRMSAQLRLARGAFDDVVKAHFDEWGLTEAEKDVALLAIKGLSLSEIADVRGSQEGTIKAQSAAVYRKAGVSGRLQLLSLFIEDLMGDPLLPQTSKSNRV